MKKNVAILSKSLKNGGAERAVANLSKDLSDKYNIYLFLFDATEIAYPYTGNIVELNFGQYKGISGKFKFIRLLKHLKKEYSISVSISFLPQVNLYNVLSRNRDKTICSIRNTMSESKLTLIDRWSIIYSGLKADRVVSLSEGARLDLIKNFYYSSKKTITIYNSCNKNWFMRESKEVDDLIKGFDFSAPVIVTAGRMTHAKGQWHLLRAFSLVVKKIPDSKLVLFGQGVYMEKLKEYASLLGIESNVFFLGYIKNHHRFLEKCRLFVFPSIYEGLGNVLLEALACGIPVISTNCPNGPSEILEGKLREPLNTIKFCKYGVLVPEFSHKEFEVDDINLEKSDYLLADAILSLLNDRNLLQRYRDSSIERIKYFSPENISHQWIDLIEELV